MDKPKFKLSRKEMLAFNDDCDSAARQCPQYRGCVVEDRAILLGDISAKELVSIWLNNPTLFEYGYDKELTDDAQEIISNYKAYKAAKRLWKKGAIT